MNDMSQVIIPKSDQWNSDDFISGPITFTIKEVQINAGSEQPVNILLDGSDKAFRPCKSMSRVLVQAWGADAKAYIGRSVTLYRDPEVKWGGMAVGGIRISHLSHIDGVKTMILTATKGSRKPHKVMPLVIEESASDDPAAKWAGQYIAKLATLTTPTDLGAFVDSKASKLAELESKRPDLHGQVTGARDARAAALSTDPFDDDGPHPASATADRILTQLAKVETVIDLDKLRLDCANDMEAMPDEMSATLNGAFDGARERLGGAA